MAFLDVGRINELRECPLRLDLLNICGLLIAEERFHGFAKTINVLLPFRYYHNSFCLFIINDCSDNLILNG